LREAFIFTFTNVNTFGIVIGPRSESIYEGWNFNSGNYLFTTNTK